MRLRRPAPLAVAATVLALSVTGCTHDQQSGTEALDAPQSAAPAAHDSGSPATGSPSSPSPDATDTPVPSPSTSSRSANSATTSGPAALDVAGLAASIRHTMATYRSAHVSMRMSGTSTITASGAVRYTSRGPQMKMRMRMPSLGVKTVQMRLVGGKVYLAMPPLTPRGKFVLLDPSDPNNPYASSVAGLTQLNPLRSFQAVEQALRKVRYVGRDTVQGEPMAHYRVTVDSRAAAKITGQQLPTTVPRRITEDLWLDGKQRMRKMRLRELGMTVVSTVSDWGAPVHVRPPARANVLTMPGSGA